MYIENYLLLFQRPIIMADAFFAGSHHAKPFLQKLNEDLHKKSQFMGSCIVWTGSQDKYGYGIHRITICGKRVKLRVHRLSCYLGNCEQILSREIHVSHLCHTKLCIRLEHLSYESPAVNNSRKECSTSGECIGHRGYSSCIL